MVTHYPVHTLCQNRCQSHRPEIIIDLFYIGFLWNWYYELFQVRETDMLSRNNWNRWANTGPSCSAHTLSTLPIRPSRPGALEGLNLEKTWNRIFLFHTHRTWDQWVTGIVTFSAEVSYVKTGIKPVQLICKTTWIACFNSLSLIFPTHHCIQPHLCIFCITHFEFFLHLVSVCEFGQLCFPSKFRNELSFIPSHKCLLFLFK